MSVQAWTRPDALRCVTQLLSSQPAVTPNTLWWSALQGAAHEGHFHLPLVCEGKCLDDCRPEAMHTCYRTHVLGCPETMQYRSTTWLASHPAGRDHSCAALPRLQCCHLQLGCGQLRRHHRLLLPSIKGCLTPATHPGANTDTDTVTHAPTTYSTEPGLCGFIAGA